VRVVDEDERPPRSADGPRPERGRLGARNPGPDGAAGGATVSDRLSTRPLASETRGYPAGGCPARGGRHDDLGDGGSAVRLVTVIVQVPRASGRPVNRQTTSSGVTATSNGRVEQRAPHLPRCVGPGSGTPPRGQRQRLTGDRDPYGHLNRRGLERQSPATRGHAAPVVQRAGQRPTQKNTPATSASAATVRAKRRVATVPSAPRAHGIEPFDLPPGGRAQLDPVERDACIARRSRRSSHLDRSPESQCRRRRSVDRHPRRGGECLLQHRLLYGIRAPSSRRGAPHQRRRFASGRVG